MSVRTRFAPSPTGFLHIGGVRTALFNWLLARHHGGRFILRIDDTDQQRHVDRAVSLILDGFRWLGMDWDEGPEVGGEHGPYFQSQRGQLYQDAVQKLMAAGVVYRDYSTEAERAADKAAAEAEKRAYRFRRKPLTNAQLSQYEAEGRPFALRFEVPPGRTLVLDDQIKGRVEMKTDEVSDFVIVRPDGSPLYNFASVVDDAEMRITHVVRAEEHLSNTFPQLLLFEALGYPLPTFAHVPYVAAPGSKKKLSKRDGAVGLHEFINDGYLPEGMLNYLARLGWSYDDSSEIFSKAELIEKFTLDRVNSSPASHDPDKLYWIQGEWMKTADLDRKVRLTAPYIHHADAWTAYDRGRKDRKEYPASAEDQEILPFLREPAEVSDAEADRFKAVIEALGDRLKLASDIVKLARYFFTEELTYDPDAVKKRLKKEGVPEILADIEALLAEVEPFDLATLEDRIKSYAESRGEGIGKVVNAVRVATTGQGVGPGLYDCLVILGRESCIRRIAQTRRMLAESSS
ncbi:glutamate--tRNA ligase [Tautonia sociabilis]|uniref:Glutamate--tRNA ligase n=1 Tax=Tautonia sociabilis TaxID=2080755 RepID=A0A432MM29_9BACT|nr:glutamate--tRNA ligase [Tautonia sociabilis]RUL88185.1 glutamate--tRNA ligase [Tautonia sociabilis]